MNTLHLSVEPNLFRPGSLLHVWKDSPPFTAKCDIFRYCIEVLHASSFSLKKKKHFQSPHTLRTFLKIILLSTYTPTFSVLHIFWSLLRQSAVKFIYLITLDFANPELTPRVVSFSESMHLSFSLMKTLAVIICSGNIEKPV